MHRAFLLVFSAALLAGCATQHHRTVVVGAQTYCAKHHRPLISVRGFQSSSNPLMLVQDADPRSVPCDEHSPNRIGDDQHLTRNSIHVERTTVTYCPICATEYWQCMGGGQSLSEHDIQQITALALQQRGFRRPVIRIVPVYDRHALVVGGGEDHVGDIFTDLGVAQRHGRWVVAYPIDSHRIVAVGRSPWIPSTTKRPNQAMERTPDRFASTF